MCKLVFPIPDETKAQQGPDQGDQAIQPRDDTCHPRPHTPAIRRRVRLWEMQQGVGLNSIPSPSVRPPGAACGVGNPPKAVSPSSTQEHHTADIGCDPLTDFGNPFRLASTQQLGQSVGEGSEEDAQQPTLRTCSSEEVLLLNSPEQPSHYLAELLSGPRTRLQSPSSSAKELDSLGDLRMSECTSWGLQEQSLADNWPDCCFREEELSAGCWSDVPSLSWSPSEQLTSIMPSVSITVSHTPLPALPEEVSSTSYTHSAQSQHTAAAHATSLPSPSLLASESFDEDAGLQRMTSSTTPLHSAMGHAYDLAAVSSQTLQRQLTPSSDQQLPAQDPALSSGVSWDALLNFQMLHGGSHRKRRHNELDADISMVEWPLAVTGNSPNSQPRQHDHQPEIPAIGSACTSQPRHDSSQPENHAIGSACSSQPRRDSHQPEIIAIGSPGTSQSSIMQEVLAPEMRQLQVHKQQLEGLQADLQFLHIAGMMQTAQEQKLAALADHLLRLRASGASPKLRKRLIVQTLSEFDEIRRPALHASKQEMFIPSSQLEELSRCQGFSMEAAVNSVLSGSFNATISISVGPLAGQHAVSEALTAPIQQYIVTQQSYLSALEVGEDQGKCVAEARGQCNSAAGRHAARMMTEVIALSLCTMHARKRRLTWFQHVNLQTLRAGKIDLRGWLRVAEAAGITQEQRQQLIQLRDEYIIRTEEALAHRMQLWQNMSKCLAGLSKGTLDAGSRSQSCSQDELAVVDALKLNLELHLNIYAHMMRAWTMVILTPYQMGVICTEAVSLTGPFTQDCPGMYLLEALAVNAGQPTTREVLSRVGNAPVLATFAAQVYQNSNSWQTMRAAAAVDPRMN
ncbi:hypothetical protein WJX74_006153 [Apatococcus lobatus]|uniref:Uncharacterized protein n=1 Tax=Apatococcus lobatus TaxID=904363 RepID=A0AAW1SF56_9CHLO